MKLETAVWCLRCCIDLPALRTSPCSYGTDIGTTGHSENMIAYATHISCEGVPYTITFYYRTTRMLSADYSVAKYLSVSLSVCQSVCLSRETINHRVTPPF